jgi:micrococcal nuclease
LKLLAGLVLVLAAAGVNAKDTGAYRVIGIQDGDTLTVLRDRRPVRVRLAFVDSPERRQGYGERARQSLSSMCYGKNAVITVLSTDRYRRPVARVSCAGVDVSRAQVARGFAWVYVQYNKDPSLPALQAAAAAKRRGLWAEPHPVPPWDFRRAGRKAAGRAAPLPLAATPTAPRRAVVVASGNSSRFAGLYASIPSMRSNSFAGTALENRNP